MNRMIAALLIACFLTSVVFSNAWAAHEGFELSKLLIIVILSCALWAKLSYSELLLKSLAFIVFLDAVWNVGQFFMDGAYQGPLELLNALIFLPWLAWASRRSYKPIKEIVEPGVVYWVAHKPNNVTGFIVSLFGGPVGGSSVLIDGRVYGYRKGRFINRQIPDGVELVAKKSGVYKSPELIHRLENMAGKKWSLIYNCITLRWCGYVR